MLWQQQVTWQMACGVRFKHNFIGRQMLHLLGNKEWNPNKLIKEGSHNTSAREERFNINHSTKVLQIFFFSQHRQRQTLGILWKSRAASVSDGELKDVATHHDLRRCEREKKEGKKKGLSIHVSRVSSEPESWRWRPAPCLCGNSEGARGPMKTYTLWSGFLTAAPQSSFFGHTLPSSLSLFSLSTLSPFSYSFFPHYLTEVFLLASSVLSLLYPKTLNGKDIVFFLNNYCISA